MKNLAQKVGETLLAKGMKLAAAESCTGGWVSQAVTAVPGSSGWFDCGFVSYSNTAKHKMLGVDLAVLEKSGAVSEPVVAQMAEGALRNSDADIAVAISGLAGPGGGSEDKPVGTVWFAWAVEGHPTVTCLSFFNGGRDEIRQQAVEQALEGIMAYLPH
ncbi:CinA family protein [Marinobacterium sediminicola]|uniref:Nicotinamide-nucleotide amidase n=1 Tax=Marinobacterium sediminicola TaxID=518898 RepID=A0ABY1S041_9GAMM|nr:CinA family protein [Marinobacterium sediminicola]ULG69709.1 CinA family protein [Marinobacterium sediminicola]SMR74561.1 nicotinamide-nucleotide amidase [Marinobacterium sediminicola]